MKASVFEANSFRGIRKTEEVENVGIIQILLPQLKEVIVNSSFICTERTSVFFFSTLSFAVMRVRIAVGKYVNLLPEELKDYVTATSLPLRL